MNTYAIIDTGGKQLRVEPGRFYDVCDFTSLNKNTKKVDSTTKIVIHRVLLIRQNSIINIGSPWVKNAIVKGRILHPCSSKKIIVHKMRSKKKTRIKKGYRKNLIRFIVDSSCMDGKEVLYL